MPTSITVVSVNISEKKGTIKVPVPKIELNELGVASDAHAGNWHRQVSLLADESVQRFTHAAGRKINYGEFAENITTKGLELVNTHPLDRLTIGDVELEITQIGKECHGTSCAIFKEVGNCVMPKEGIFARVLKNGTVKAGDKVTTSTPIAKVGSTGRSTGSHLHFEVRQNDHAIDPMAYLAKLDTTPANQEKRTIQLASANRSSLQITKTL